MSLFQSDNAVDLPTSPIPPLSTRQRYKPDRAFDSLFLQSLAGREAKRDLSVALTNIWEPGVRGNTCHVIDHASGINEAL
jgi:hypothetical protein